MFCLIKLIIMMEIIVNQFEQGVYGYEEKDGETTFGLIDEEKADKIENDFIKQM